MEHTLLPDRVQLSDTIRSGLGPAGTTRECHRLRGEGGESRGRRKSVFDHPTPLFSSTSSRREQDCYNLFSWLSMKERGRAARASVRLDLLPLTPTVYLLSTISSFPAFSLPICPLSFSCSSAFASLAHRVSLWQHFTTHPSRFAHCVSFLTVPSSFCF